MLRAPKKSHKNMGKVNLYSKRVISQQKVIKGMGKKYKIPTIINERVSSEATAVTLGQGSTSPRGEESEMSKQHVLLTHIQIRYYCLEIAILKA